MVIRTKYAPTTLVCPNSTRHRKLTNKDVLKMMTYLSEMWGPTVLVREAAGNDGAA